MVIILHTHEHLSLHGFRMNLKCSKFQEVLNQAPINAFTIMSAPTNHYLLGSFSVELAKSYTRKHTIMLCKDSHLHLYYSHFIVFFKKDYTYRATLRTVLTECPVSLLTSRRLSPFRRSFISWIYCCFIISSLLV